MSDMQSQQALGIWIAEMCKILMMRDCEVCSKMGTWQAEINADMENW